MAFVKLQKGYTTGHILCLRSKINFPCEQSAAHINTSSQEASAGLETLAGRQEGNLVKGSFRAIGWFWGWGCLSVCLQTLRDVMWTE